MATHEELAYHHATVVYKRMPGNIRGFTMPNLDGYTIIINSELGPEEQHAAILHELEHIRRGDLFNTDYVEYAF